MDKRILKTKKNLKDTFIEMLSVKSFEQITVKELCEKSRTSRITFYTHYDDKYDLVDDISEDMIKMAQEEYQNLQKKNNPSKDSVISYCNFLDCILNIYYKNIKFFLNLLSFSITLSIFSPVCTFLLFSHSFLPHFYKNA